MDKKNKDQDSSVKFMPIFMSIGLSVGMALGSAFGNIAVGMCIGLALGLCIGAGLDAKNVKKDGTAPDESTVDDNKEE